MASKRCLEALSGDARCKVKGFAPSVLIGILSQVIIEIVELLVVAFPLLQFFSNPPRLAFLKRSSYSWMVGAAREAPRLPFRVLESLTDIVTRDQGSVRYAIGSAKGSLDLTLAAVR